jgi:predicted PurR-regulated permease PerM
MSFWDIIWFIFVSFAFIAYLMFMFNIIGDLFRDHTVSGWVKALWMICLIFFPFLTAIIYLVVRGKGMYERQASAINEARAGQEEYIRTVASTSPTDQIAQAKGLLDSGAISQAEFDALKAKALS